MSDSPIKQLAKRHLERQLREAGIEIDNAPQERGTDLIAILGPVGASMRSARCKIKIMAYEEDRFILFRNWKEKAYLLVYAWNVSTAGADLYALSYDEAFTLLKERRHTETQNWKEENHFVLSIGTGEVRTWWTNHLSGHLMDTRKLREKIYSVCTSRSTMEA